MSPATAPPAFNLLRWFSCVSVGVVATVGALSAWAVSTYFVESTLQRDAELSGQFIQLIAEAEVRHAQLVGEVTMGELLDGRLDVMKTGISPATIAWVRGEFFDHVVHLPDALLVNIFAPDHVIVLSSNPELVGQHADDSTELDEAFRTRRMSGSVHAKPERLRSEQRFLFGPEELYVENYIPLVDASGRVASVVEIYKEPRDLLNTLKRGYVLIWLVGLASAGVIWSALFWIVRHGATQLREQHRKLVENETLVAIGELSSAVAHGLRNPLASIRSSAELAMDADIPPIRKNLEDIVTQVDRMSKWVRELLLFSRPPLNEACEGRDLFAAVGEALRVLESQMRRVGIELEWSHSGPSPRVVAHEGLLLQALNSVLSNAVEAMPRGGRLTVATAPAGKGRVALTVRDTGGGMKAEQLAMAFKLYYSTKRNGLGVGLPLVRRIMERFGGAVEIESGEGAGTLVRLIFVLA